MEIDKVIAILKEHVEAYKVPTVTKIGKQTRDPFRVLVSTILSARTKDAVTGAASERLFAVVKKSEDLKLLSVEEISKIIYPVMYYNNKSRYLKQLPEFLKNGVPDTINELLKLPGVGRKTANLVITVGFNKPAICVDTHVHRITNIWGYVDTKNPHETEMALREKLPKEHWNIINHYLVAFGQNLCTPISPHCSKCPISKYCKRIGVQTSR
jgi:endonuclease III